ncbi:hypothetical protein B0T16DRAFT_216710 [Cercophora newfieldiana]|uniref:Uncharacterized protein n=1 Tax=Cercophora newfieldiana TaxID=92897 RepID=A0AA40CLN3_9PEZI|nr:hypothetical protein B0T16DRAFT_216710 [Cercophora newfieldiana]
MLHPRPDLRLILAQSQKRSSASHPRAYATPTHLQQSHSHRYSHSHSHSHSIEVCSCTTHTEYSHPGLRLPTPHLSQTPPVPAAHLIYPDLTLVVPTETFPLYIAYPPPSTLHIPQGMHMPISLSPHHPYIAPAIQPVTVAADVETSSATNLHT